MIPLYGNDFARSRWANKFIYSSHIIKLTISNRNIHCIIVTTYLVKCINLHYLCYYPRKTSYFMKRKSNMYQTKIHS